MIAIEKISLAQYQKDRLDTAPGTQMTLPQLEEEYAGIILPGAGRLYQLDTIFTHPFLNPGAWRNSRGPHGPQGHHGG
ncbi:MAG: hypothetical protein ACLR23_23250 [Clostridia bacterium]